MRSHPLAAAIGAGALVLLTSGRGLTADDAVFFMELPSGALPSAVGANASVVPANRADGGALYWMPTTGVEDIGGRSTNAISRDGRTIIGRALDSGGFENAAIWVGGKQWRVLGSFGPQAKPCDQLLSGSFGASDDGKVIVGLGWNGCSYAHAFRWEDSTGVVDLGSLNQRSTRANAVSGDGKVIVGWQEDVTGFRLAAKWTNGTEELINGPSAFIGEARDVNRDGSIIVGGVCDATVTTMSAWMWTAAAGVRCFPVQKPAFLPDLPYQTLMMATSDDGRVVGGSFTFGLDAESVLWLDGQPAFLKDYLIQSGVKDAFRGWVNTGFITGVSPDGRTIVGYGAGPTNFQGFIAILPERK